MNTKLLFFFIPIFLLFMFFSCDSGIKRMTPGAGDKTDNEENLNDTDISENDKDIAETDSDIEIPLNDEDQENTPDEEPDNYDPCEGVDCNNHGKCLLDDNDEPYCYCDDNFYPVLGELLCVNDCVNESGDILSGSPCTHPVNQDPSWSKDCYIASCDPEGLCIGQASYNGHSCTHNLTSSEWDSECFEGVCNEAACQPVKYPEGTDCDDGTFCNGTEQCSAGGKCVSSGDPCADGITCNDHCNEDAENCFSPENTSCDDGNPCTGENLCSGDGVCLNGINPCDPQPCTPDPEHEDGYFCCPEGTYGDDCSICVRKVTETSIMPIDPDGKTWSKAYGDIQQAINDLNEIIGVDCSGGKEVWISAGKYIPASNMTVYGGISIYGGFNGTESTKSARDWKNNIVTISGENLGTERIFNMDSETVLDGLTLSDSNYEHDGADRYGGALLITEKNNVSIHNCTFRNNRIQTNRDGFGGAIMVYNSENIGIYNSRFIENWSNEGGGAIYSRGSSILIEQCLFNKNNSGARGGGTHTDSGTTTIINSIFTENNANDYGGAVYTRYSGSHTYVTNSTFWGNSITNDGNSSGSTFHTYDRADVTLKNIILWNSIRGNPIQNNSYSDSTVTYSNITGGHSGTGNIDSDPLFVDPGNGNLKLGTGSPSIDTGTEEGAPLEDYEGTSRPKGSGFDMGAYEQ